MTIEGFEQGYIQEAISQLPRCSVTGRYMRIPRYIVKRGGKVYFDFDDYYKNPRVRGALDQNNMTVENSESDARTRFLTLHLIDLNDQNQKPLVLTECSRQAILLYELCRAICRKDETLLDKFKPHLEYYMNKPYDGMSILQHAARADGDLEGIKILLDAGASLKPYAVGTDSPLTYAVCQKNSQLVKLLLAYGARSSSNLLSRAKNIGNVQVIQLLEDEALRRKNVAQIKATQERMTSDLALVNEYQQDSGFHYLGFENDSNRIIFNCKNIKQYVTDWLSGINAAEDYVKRACQANNIEFFDLLNELQSDAEASRLFSLALDGAEDTELISIGASHKFIVSIWEAGEGDIIAKILERANALGLVELVLQEETIRDRILEKIAFAYIEDPLFLCTMVQSCGIQRLDDENKYTTAAILFREGLSCMLQKSENDEEKLGAIISLLFEFKGDQEEIVFDFYLAMLMQDVDALINLEHKDSNSFKALIGSLSATQMSNIQNLPFYVQLFNHPAILNSLSGNRSANDSKKAALGNFFKFRKRGEIVEVYYPSGEEFSGNSSDEENQDDIPQNSHKKDGSCLVM